MSEQRSPQTSLDGISGIPAIRWLQVLLNETEDDFIQFIQQDLSVLRHVFSCRCVFQSGSVCSCAKEMELLVPCDQLDLLCDRIYQYHSFGVCPHIAAAVMDSDIANIDDILGCRPSVIRLAKIRDGNMERSNETYSSWTTKDIHSVLNRIPPRVLNDISKVCQCNVFHFAVILRKSNVIQWLLTNEEHFHVYLPGIFNDFQNSTITKAVQLCIYHSHLDILRLILGKLNNFIRALSPVFAIDSRNFEAFEILLSYYKRFGRRIYKYARTTSLTYAFTQKSFDFVRYLKKMGICLYRIMDYTFPMPIPYEECQRSVVKGNDMKLIREFLKIKTNGQSRRCKVQALLSQGVVFNKTLVVEYLCRKANTEDYREVFKNNVVTIAVLNNSPAVLDLLLHNNCQQPPENKAGYTARDWASFLGATECQAFLEKFNYPCWEGDPRDTSPLLSLFDIKNTEHIRHRILKILIDNGYDVNFESPNGVSPLQKALQNRDIESAKILLLNDANPFEGQTFFTSLSTPHMCLFLKYLLLCNVNCCGYLIVIIRLIYNLVFPSRNTYILHFLLIFLEHHDLSHKDQQYVISMFGLDYESQGHYREFPNVKKALKNHLFEPKPLQVICRNKVRHSFPSWRLFSLIEKVNIPVDLKNVLLLREYKCLQTDVILF